MWCFIEELDRGIFKIRLALILLSYTVYSWVDSMPVGLISLVLCMAWILRDPEKA